MTNIIPALARVFGYYECKRCQNNWKSSYTWNVIDTAGNYCNQPEMYMSPTTNITLKTYYRQPCSYCNNNIFPYQTTLLAATPQNNLDENNTQMNGKYNNGGGKNNRQMNGKYNNGGNENRQRRYNKPRYNRQAQHLQQMQNNQYHDNSGNNQPCNLQYKLKQTQPIQPIQTEEFTQQPPEPLQQQIQFTQQPPEQLQQQQQQQQQKQQLQQQQ